MFSAILPRLRRCPQPPPAEAVPPPIGDLRHDPVEPRMPPGRGAATSCPGRATSVRRQVRAGQPRRHSRTALSSLLDRVSGIGDMRAGDLEGLDSPEVEPGPFGRLHEAQLYGA